MRRIHFSFSLSLGLFFIRFNANDDKNKVSDKNGRQQFKVGIWASFFFFHSPVDDINKVGRYAFLPEISIFHNVYLSIFVSSHATRWWWCFFLFLFSSLKWEREKKAQKRTKLSMKQLQYDDIYILKKWEYVWERNEVNERENVDSHTNNLCV